MPTTLEHYHLIKKKFYEMTIHNKDRIDFEFNGRVHINTYDYFSYEFNFSLEDLELIMQHDPEYKFTIKNTGKILVEWWKIKECIRNQKLSESLLPEYSEQ